MLQHAGAGRRSPFRPGIGAQQLLDNLSPSTLVHHYISQRNCFCRRSSWPRRPTSAQKAATNTVRSWQAPQYSVDNHTRPGKRDERRAVLFRRKVVSSGMPFRGPVSGRLGREPELAQPHRQPHLGAQARKVAHENVQTRAQPTQRRSVEPQLKPSGRPTGGANCHCHSFQIGTLGPPTRSSAHQESSSRTDAAHIQRNTPHPGVTPANWVTVVYSDRKPSNTETAGQATNETVVQPITTQTMQT